MLFRSALYSRERTGEGRGIKTSLFAGMADWMTVPYLHHVYGGKAPERSGLDHPSIAPYGPYRCADGAVLVSIQNEREWASLCTNVLQAPGLATEPDYADNLARVKNRDQLKERMEAILTRLPRAEVERRLKAAQVAYGGLNTVADFSKHPQLRKLPVETPSGPVDLIAPPAAIAGDDLKLRPVPKVGEQSDAIRREFAA